MFDRLLSYILTRFGFKSGRKRCVDEDNRDDDYLNEQSPKRRRTETAEEQHFFTSEQFLRPSANWRMPKKKPVIICRQEQRNMDADVLGVWQDAKTLRKCPVFKAPNNVKRTGGSTTSPSMDKPDEDDIQVVKVVESHSDEISRSGNTISIFQTPYTRAMYSNNSGSSKKSQVLLQRLRSSYSKFGQDGNGSHSGASSRSSRAEERGPKLALNESFRLEEKMRYSELLQRFTSVPLQARSRHHRAVWNQWDRRVYGRGESSQYSEVAGHAREKLGKGCTTLIDLTKPPLHKPISGRHIEMQGEAEPYTATFKQDEDEPEIVELPFTKTTSLADRLKSNYFCGKDLVKNVNRRVRGRGESSQYSKASGHPREKLGKVCTTLIDYTKSPLRKPVPGRHIEVRRDREAEPYTTTSKQDEDAPEIVELPFTKTNSLADRLKSNYFCSEDLVKNIEEKYKKKQEARERQEEEEKLKASHFQKRENKLQVEALLRMKDYLKITDAILVDDVIFEEKSVALPELTPEMQDAIDAALIPKPSDEVLVEAFGLPIKRHDMQTLAGLNWLNDEVINFYMELLKERGKLENYPSVYAFNTFFYPRLLSGGHAVLKRWTRKVDIFSYDLIIVPVHLGVHWCMAVIDFCNKTIKYYDSMGSTNNKCLQSLLKYLQDESLDKKKTPFDTSGWKLTNMEKIPQQMNGSDCGMFACTYAEFICRNADITFTQEDMAYFRRKMVYEILTRKLLM